MYAILLVLLSFPLDEVLVCGRSILDRFNAHCVRSTALLCTLFPSIDVPIVY
jgi:hypothetical protein